MIRGVVDRHFADRHMMGKSDLIHHLDDFHCLFKTSRFKEGIEIQAHVIGCKIRDLPVSTRQDAASQSAIGHGRHTQIMILFQIPGPLVFQKRELVLGKVQDIILIEFIDLIVLKVADTGETDLALLLQGF